MSAPMSDPGCRLYLITPPRVDDVDAFAAAAREAFAGGDVACLQIRLKTPDGVAAPDAHVAAVYGAVAPLARDAGAAVLINDRPDLAEALGADGVHIGQADASLKDARARLGPEASIGVTCHASIDLAFAAGEGGADYVAFGAFFDTATKAAPTRAEPDLLARWSAMTVVPCVAIGGITPSNCAPLVQAGADFLAVSSAVWDAQEGPRAVVAAFAAAVDAATRA
ncbi:MAG: thiamine phosphate synthase [Pseudomonadota bacterium]